MQKPKGYEEAQAGQGRPQITPGGHHLIIKQVNETTSKSGKPMIVVLFDFAPNDAHKGMLMEEFKADTRSDKKWPHRGTAYIMVQDYQDPDKTSRNYKTFCTCFEKSNDVKINWTDNAQAWAAQFKDKRIGGAFGKVHDVYNGRETIKTEMRWFITDQSVEGCEPPAEKFLSLSQQNELDSYKQQDNGTPSTADGFITIPDGVDAELPFN